MVGVAPYPVTTIDDPQIISFGNNYLWNKASEPIDNPFNQVDTVSEDLSTITKYGTSAEMAQTVLAANPTKTIALIPCAKAGSSITEWQQDPSTSTLYGSMLNRVNEVTDSGTYPLSAIMFIQGETDAGTLVDANAWATKFTQFVTDIRSDLGYNVPIVFVRLGDVTPAVKPYWTEVRTGQTGIAISDVVMVDSDGIWTTGLHMDTAMYTAVGIAMGNAYNANF